MKINKGSMLGVVIGVTVLGLITVAWAQATKPADLTGTWTWTTEGFGGQQETTLTLKQDGEKLTGSITGFQGENPISDGKVKNGEVTFKVVADFGGRQLVTQYVAKWDGNSLKGKSELIIANEFNGTRAK